MSRERDGDQLDIVPIRFQRDRLWILDQTLLPVEEKWRELTTKEEVWDSIYKLQVRGAPAIGVTAAFGAYICMKNRHVESFEEFYREFQALHLYLDSARPTAVNLSWALARLDAKVRNGENRTVPYLLDVLRQEALAIQREDQAACRALGGHGLSLLSPGMGILTHCNAGALATAKYGTALSPLYLGQVMGYGFQVFVDETRPLLQGARLTAWELSQSGIDVTLICDSMAAAVMKKGWIQAVLVGCDRMAANGDGANKIGTAGVAVLAKEYGIPFYMFVPTSTIDWEAESGEDIPVELRDGEEIRSLWYEKPMAPQEVKTYNPAFDVTDAKYITAVITEKGIAYPPYGESLKQLCK